MNTSHSLLLFFSFVLVLANNNNTKAIPENVMARQMSKRKRNCRIILFITNRFLKILILKEKNRSRISTQILCASSNGIFGKEERREKGTFSNQIRKKMKNKIQEMFENVEINRNQLWHQSTFGYLLSQFEDMIFDQSKSH